MIRRIETKTEQKITSLSKWDAKKVPEPIKYYIPENLQLSVSELFQISYTENLDFERRWHIRPCEKNRMEAFIGGSSIAKGDESEMYQIVDIVRCTLKIALFGENFEKMKECFNEANSKHRSLINEIQQILKLIKVGIPLKGQCETGKIGGFE